MKIALGILVALLGLSCSSWDPQKLETTLQAISQMEGAGAITAAQGEALREAVEAAGDGITGGEVMEWLGAVLVAILGSLLGVRRMRGPAKPLSGPDAAVLTSFIQQLKDKP